MSIIKETIRLFNTPTGTTIINISGHTPITGITGIMNISFGLGSGDDFLGYQQEIDNLTQVVSLDIVNPEIDVEERRFNYIPNIGPLTLEFNFHQPNAGNVFHYYFSYQGFTVDEERQNASNMQNSFFIMDYYDTFDINTQTKIFTTYLTKITSGEWSVGLPEYTEPFSEYVINGSSSNQLYYWYVPVWYIKANLTGTTNTVTGYTKFTFYNAKSGTTALFYNSDNDTVDANGYVNPQKMYFKTELNLANMTWKILTPPSHNNVIIANQLWNSPAYNDKVNNTVQNFNNEQQDYPSGNTFNYLNGTYETL